MNQVANVLFAYQPKNDDELELKVGDKIEVIGFEEEGWWKGRLHGRTGVFPSNFVRVNQESSTQSNISSNIAPVLLSSSTTNISANSAVNKLNFLGNRATKTNSLSSNSLNSNSSLNNNNNNFHNNTNNNHNNRSLTMNNTQRLDSNPLMPASHVGSNGDDSGEKKPKPIRGIGYGDIFAAGAKPKPRPGDHVVSPTIVNALQKQIPKKPPPPTPTNDNNGSMNGSQAPALPPKPASQFSPHPMQHQHSRPQLPLQNSTLASSHKQQQVARERAKVLFPYDPSNDDELALQVGDIIDIIDKEIEDAGWWKGELRGKVGVFPDNFVELIDETPSQDWLQHRASTTSQSVTPVLNSTGANTEGRVRSVFSVTPKGFSKELENNLEKQQQHNNNPASFLSLKRNKLPSTGSTDNSNQPNMSDSSEKKSDTMNNNENNNNSSTETSPTARLNHITANRAKGPSRRPPTNLLNKKVAQNDQSARSIETNGKSDHNNHSPMASLPVTNLSNQLTNHESMPSLSTPSSQHLNQQSTTPTTIGQLSKSNDSSPLNEHLTTPRTSQRLAQQNPANENKNTSSASTPPWMVELRKAHAEKKRDTPVVPTTTSQVTPTTAPTTQVTHASTASMPWTPSLDELLKKSERAPVKSTELNQTAQPPAAVPSPVGNVAPELTAEQLETLTKMISKNVANEVKELKDEVKQLRDELKSVMEVKDALETMKLDLKICQSATENQKKYIKELVSNLADEHRKLAAMQAEIDRNLK